MPQWELWSWRGLESLPDLGKGVLRRRRWDKDEAKVNLLST
jgi:hypothetical protein